jgi:hypothetical protein
MLNNSNVVFVDSNGKAINSSNIDKSELIIKVENEIHPESINVFNIEDLDDCNEILLNQLFCYEYFKVLPKKAFVVEGDYEKVNEYYVVNSLNNFKVVEELNPLSPLTLEGIKNLVIIQFSRIIEFFDDFPNVANILLPTNMINLLYEYKEDITNYKKILNIYEVFKKKETRLISLSKNRERENYLMKNLSDILYYYCLNLDKLNYIDCDFTKLKSENLSKVPINNLSSNQFEAIISYVSNNVVCMEMLLADLHNYEEELEMIRKYNTATLTLDKLQ